MLRRILFIFLTIICFCPFLYGYPKNIYLYKGKDKISVDTFLGKTTAIFFWAYWCEACKQELLDLDKSEWQNLNNIRFILVCLDKETMRESESWAKKNLSFKLFDTLHFDPELLFPEAVELESLPGHLIFDTKGNKIYAGKSDVKALIKFLEKSNLIK